MGFVLISITWEGVLANVQHFAAHCAGVSSLLLLIGHAYIKALVAVLQAKYCSSVRLVLMIVVTADDCDLGILGFRTIVMISSYHVV